MYFLQEALAYVKRQEYELSLLRYISDEFSIIDRKLSNWNKSQEKPRDDSEETESEKVK